MSRERFGRLIREYRRAAMLSQESLAKAACVSRSVVNRAENSGEATQQVARAIIEVLSQRVDISRRELRDLAEAFLISDSVAASISATKLIALVVPDSYRNAFWSRVTGMIETRAEMIDWRVVHFQHLEDVGRELRSFDVLTELESLAGVILAPALGQELLSDRRHSTTELALLELEKRGIPIVLIDRRKPDSSWGADRWNAPYVGPNNRLGAMLATRLLTEMGHRRIAGLFDDVRFASHYAERLAGYHDALAEIGAKPDDALIRYGSSGMNFGADHARLRSERERTLIHELLTLPDSRRPTAVFCSNYGYAMLVVSVAKELQRGIPDDVSIVAFDDIPELDLVQPRITRVGYRLDVLAFEAFAKLTRLITSPEGARTVKDELIEDFYVVRRDSIRRV
jgi:DNA-binding LacI/PurR family transcriptional regulator